MWGDSKTLSSPVGGSKTNSKNDVRKEQSIYVELQSIRIGGTFPGGLSAVKKRLAIKTIASQTSTLDQNNSAAKSFYHRSHFVAKPFRQQTLHQIKPLKVKRALLYRG